MRRVIFLLSLMFGAVIPAVAQVSVGIGIGLPSLSIGINFPIYPEMQPVPGYPVYYAPQANGNFFFYDGMYWVYQNDNWYASTWYNGPWAMAAPMAVPLFILRVPVSYYRQPPVYFHGWRQDAPPQWGDHWGNDWQRQRTGWDHWNHNSVPAAAPLPTYQQKYSGSQYPSVEQQQTLHAQNYHYQPHEPVVQQHYQKYVVAKAPASQKQQPQRQSQQHQPQPSGQDRPPAAENTAKPPKHPPQTLPSGQDRPPAAENPSKPPKHPPQTQPSGQDRPPAAENTSKQPSHPPKQQPSGQDRPPGQAENTSKQPPHPQQQPPAQDHRPPGQAEDAPKPPKQDQGKQESGDKGQDKEGERDNR